MSQELQNAQKFVSIPAALLDDTVSVMASGTFGKYSFSDIANIISALTHFKSQAARESGNAASAPAPLAAVPATVESDMGEPATS